MTTPGQSFTARGSASGKIAPSPAPAAVATAVAPAPELPLAVVAAQHPELFTTNQAPVLLQLSEAFLAATSEAGAVDAPGAPPATSAAPASNAERWVDAQTASDERFSSMFGYTAFNAMQLQRARETMSEALSRQVPTTP